MSCKSCQSNNQLSFRAEVNIHRPGFEGGVFVFPDLVVCLDCGFTEFALPEFQMRLLAQGDSSAA